MRAEEDNIVIDIEAGGQDIVLHNNTKQYEATEKDDGKIDNSNYEYTMEGYEGTLIQGAGEFILGNDIEAEPLNPLEWSATLALVDRGAWMKSKSGIAGSSPLYDSFPWFQQHDVAWIQLLWDMLPSDWRLISFQKPPKDAYDPDEYLQGRLIMIKDISEVMLEVEPSTSFRIYLGDTNQVVKLTPSPVNRQHAATWVNAIYAAMQLQALEETYTEEDEEDDGNEISRLPQLLDLREKYYEIHPDELPPAFVDDEPEPMKGAVVNTKENTKNESVLGRQSHRMSLTFDFSQIYGSGQDTFSSGGGPNEQQGDAQRNPNDQQCCAIQ